MEIKRDYYLNQLISKMHNGLIKVVTGMRRCWKSYLLFNLFREYLISKDIDKDHIIEISFDTFENKKFCNPDILYPYFKELIKDDKMYYILLDEVQLMGEFESILNSLNRSKTIKKSSKGSKSKSPLLLFYYRKLKNRKGNFGFFQVSRLTHWCKLRITAKILYRKYEDVKNPIF